MTIRSQQNILYSLLSLYENVNKEIMLGTRKIQHPELNTPKLNAVSSKSYQYFIYTRSIYQIMLEYVFLKQQKIKTHATRLYQHYKSKKGLISFGKLIFSFVNFMK